MKTEDTEGAGATLAKLRLATGTRHSALEARFDAVGELSDPVRRPGMIARYACLYGPALKVLALHLSEIVPLQFPRRLRAWEAAGMAPGLRLDAPAFPTLGDRYQALGAMYVIEGSTLGGRTIRRRLAARGVGAEGLSFLDPYGKSSGAMWRGLLAVLEEEGRSDASAIESMCCGAMKGFAYAERTLCVGDQ